MKAWLLSLMLATLAARCLASVSITTTSLPNGTLGATYSASIKAAGGCTPYSWGIVSGSLPAGLHKKLSTSTTALVLSGTPIKAASYSFTIEVTGCGKHVSKASYKIVIQSGANHVVDLTWVGSTSTDIVGYNVYRRPAGATWEKINLSLIASTVYSDSTVANNTTYYYAATAVDVSGHESKKTTAVMAVIP